MFCFGSSHIYFYRLTIIFWLQLWKLECTFCFPRDFSDIKCSQNEYVCVRERARAYVCVNICFGINNVSSYNLRFYMLVIQLSNIKLLKIKTKSNKKKTLAYIDDKSVIKLLLWYLYSTFPIVLFHVFKWALHVK